MGDILYALASGLGAFFGLLIPILTIVLIKRHNKKLTPEQKKKSD